MASLFLNGSKASAHEIADGDAILILRTNLGLQQKVIR